MTAKQSGQTLPLVALMLFCIMGMVALVIDGSSIYSQQRRMQADLDMAVKVAASELPDTSTAQADATNLLAQRGYTNPGITIPITPTTGPYSGRSGYAEGFLTQNVRSFFAGVLGFRSMKISVHAVAEQGGNTWKPPTLLALSPDGASNGGCGVVAQGGAGVSGELDAIVHSNSQTCVKSGSIFADGKVDSDIPTAANNGNPITSTVNGASGNGTGTFISNPYNPGWTVPSPLPSAPTITKCNNKNGCTGKATCNYPVAYQDTYYQPDSTGVALISTAPNTSAGTGAYDFLPYCNPSTGNPTFGIYLFDDDLQMSSTGAVVNAYDSTFVFNYATGAKLWMTGGSLNMQGPGICPPSVPQPCAGSTSPFYGFNGTTSSIVMWQVNTPVPCSNATGMENLGGGTGTIDGIVDLPCANIKVGGNSSNSAWISGALIAWDITIAGSGSGIVTQNPAVAPALPRGSVLVQ